MTQDEREWIRQLTGANLESIKELRDKVNKLEVSQAVTSTKLSIYIAFAIGIVETIEHLVFHK